MERKRANQLEAIVHGRVQGVSFRYYTRLEAQRLGVTGWVANQPDGTVMVVAQGTDKALAQLAEFLHRGPSMARVVKVEIDWVEATTEYHRFSIQWL
jgi:acylphosphatase